LLLPTATNFDAAFQDGTIFHADANRGHVSGDRAFAADIDAVAALNVSVNLAHDHNLGGNNVGLHNAVAANGDAVVGQADFALDAAIHVKRFRAADFAFDDERTADGGLLDWRADGFNWNWLGVGRRNWRIGFAAVRVL
jgi:hypothetical protein